MGFFVKSFQYVVLNFEENSFIVVNINSSKITASECCCVLMVLSCFLAVTMDP